MSRQPDNNTVRHSFSHHFVVITQYRIFRSWRCVVYKFYPILLNRVMGDHELNSISPDHILPDYSSKDSSSDHVKRRHSRLYLSAALVLVLGVCCLVTGVVLIVLSQTQKSATESRATDNAVNEERPYNTTFSGSKNNTKTENPCALSLEAKLAGRTTDVSKFPLCIITRNLSLSVKRNPVQMLRKAIRLIFFLPMFF